MLEFPKWKIILISLICLWAIVVSSPNLMTQSSRESLPKWMPSSTLNLGLDLQGGVSLLMSIDFEEYIDEKLEDLKDEVRASLREAKIGYVGGITISKNKDLVRFKLRNPAEAVKAKEAFDDLLNSTIINISADGVGKAVYSEKYIKEMKKRAISQSIETIRRRIDETGTKEPIIQRQGDLRILLQVPGATDPEEIKGILKVKGRMTFHLMDNDNPFPSMAINPPPGMMLLEGTEGNRPYNVLKRRVMLGGELLDDAGVNYDQSGRPAITFRFNTKGAKIFAKVTKNNIGKPFAINLDNKVISAPVIQGVIAGGSGQITGDFTIKEANHLSLLLRSGALPASMEFLEERTVGPSLGADSIEAGKMASIVGVILVVVMMIVFYGLFGIFSNIALTINLILIIAVLSLFQATLTLPGIAGMVLTLGIAVDANVLIFERIREEVRNGKTPFAAIDNGFKQAFKTIIDSNITTLIATLLLYTYGSGPVKGFAVTLSVGILCSMFSAILLTRMMIVIWLKHKKPDTIPL